MSLLQHKKRKRPEMNLVALIDVLVMLIFFAFVTMQFRSAQTLNITLPKAETAGKNEFRGTVTVSIGKDGRISFATTPSNNQIVSDDELVALLQQLKNIDRDTQVLIVADEASEMKRTVFVMDMCRKVGISRFNLQSR